MIVLLTLLLIVAAAWLHTLFMAAATLLTNAPLGELSFGIGWPLYRRRVGATVVTIRAVPFGSFVRVCTPEEVDASPSEAIDGGFSLLATWKRVAIHLSGSAGLLLLGLAALGPGVGLPSFLRGFRQWCPFLQSAAESRYLILVLFQLPAHAPLLQAFALVAIKLSALNLLPVPLLNGWGVVAALLDRIWRIPYRVNQRIFLIGFFFYVLTLAAWALLSINVITGRTGSA